MTEDTHWPLVHLNSVEPQSLSTIEGRMICISQMSQADLIKYIENFGLQNDITSQELFCSTASVASFQFDYILISLKDEYLFRSHVLKL